MRYKMTFIVGFGTGYVLGSKAGRQRYDAISRTARSLWETPAVQETAGVLQAQAAGAVDNAKRRVTGAVGSKFGGSSRPSPGSPLDGERAAAMAYPTSTPTGTVMPEGGAFD